MNLKGTTYGILGDMNLLVMSFEPGGRFGDTYRLDELQVEPADLPTNDICESLKITDKSGRVLFDHKRSDFIKNGRELPSLEDYDQFAYEFALAWKRS